MKRKGVSVRSSHHKNAGLNGGPELLYTSRQQIFAPEEYVIGGDPTHNSTRESLDMLAHFATTQMVAERYRLDAWPLFNMGDGDTFPPALVRIQVVRHAPRLTSQLSRCCPFRLITFSSPSYDRLMTVL